MSAIVPVLPLLNSDKERGFRQTPELQSLTDVPGRHRMLFVLPDAHAALHLGQENSPPCLCKQAPLRDALRTKLRD